MAVVPALPDTERRTVYNPVSSTGPFDVDFDIYATGTDYQNWIEVWLDGEELTPVTDWTLALTSGTLAATARPLTNAQVTLATAATGELMIVGARRPRRTSQFTEGVGVSAHDQNVVLTDIIATLREAWDMRGRTVRGAPGTTYSEVPADTNKLIGLGDSGDIALFASILTSAQLDGTEFSTKAAFEAASAPPVTQDYIGLLGYYTVGDAFNKFWFKRYGASPPAHGAYILNNGVYWEIFNRGRTLNDRMVGTQGSGADDTAAFNKLILLGGGQITRALKVDDIDIENAVYLEFLSGAKLNMLATAQTAADSRTNWIQFLPGSAGSRIWDFDADCDYDNIFGSHDLLKAALRVGATDVRFNGVTRVTNVVGKGITAGHVLPTEEFDQPDGLVIEHLVVERFVSINQFASFTEGRIGHIVAKGYNNDGLASVPQGAVIIRECTATTVGDIITSEFGGDEDGGSTYAQPTMIFHNQHCSFGDFHNPLYEAGEHRILGTSIVSNYSCGFGKFFLHGCHEAVEDHSNRRCVFAGGHCDGHYVVRVAAGGAASSIIGWHVKGGHLAEGSASVDGIHKSGVMGNQYGPITCERGGIGFIIDEGAQTFNSPRAIGNLTDGFRFEMDDVHSSFADSTGSISSTTLNDPVAIGNGRLGCDLRQSLNLEINNPKFCDNGWDTAQTATTRAGLGTAIGSAWDNQRPTVRGGTMSNRNTWSVAASVSLQPGATDADDQADVTLVIPQYLEYGHYVNITDAEGSGNDAEGRVIDRVGDRYTLQFDAAKTFVVNAVTLTGTWKRHATNTDQLVETSGAGAAESEVTGRYWIRRDSSSEYAQVERVLDDDTIEVATMFATVDIDGDGGAGHTLSKVVYDANGVAKQNYGARLSTSHVSDMLIQDTEGRANLTADLDISPTLLRAGSRYRRSALTSVSTAAGTTTLMSIADGWAIGSCRGIVRSEITGTGAGATWEIELTGGLTTTYASALALTVGAEGIGSPTTYEISHTSTSLRTVITGGAAGDNTPDAGSIQWDLEMFRTRPGSFP